MNYSHIVDVPGTQVDLINCYVGVDRLATAAMELKTLVYSRLSSQLFPHNTQHQSFKSLIYSRVEQSASSHLEGTSFESSFRIIHCKL